MPALFYMVIGAFAAMAALVGLYMIDHPELGHTDEAGEDTIVPPALGERERRTGRE
jgi:hypothetical protein